VHPEEPLVFEGVDVLVVEPVVPVLLVEPDEEEDPAGANLTASAQVDLELERDSMTTFACVEKL